MLQSWFSIKVINYAKSGYSARMMHREGYFEKVLDLVQPGDFVVMELGRNDGEWKEVQAIFILVFLDCLVMSMSLNLKLFEHYTGTPENIDKDGKRPCEPLNGTYDKPCIMKYK